MHKESIQPLVGLPSTVLFIASVGHCQQHQSAMCKEETRVAMCCHPRPYVGPQPANKTHFLLRHPLTVMKPHSKALGVLPVVREPGKSSDLRARRSHCESPQHETSDCRSIGSAGAVPARWHAFQRTGSESR